MARFLVHLANGCRQSVEADSPEAARAIATKDRPCPVTRVKLDREAHRPSVETGRRHRRHRLHRKETLS